MSDITQVKSKVHPTMSDMEKVQSTLKQIVRDWSKDGEEERAACYNPIIEEIELNFPPAQRLLLYYNIWTDTWQIFHYHYSYWQALRTSTNFGSWCRTWKTGFWDSQKRLQLSRQWVQSLHAVCLKLRLEQVGRAMINKNFMHFVFMLFSLVFVDVRGSRLFVFIHGRNSSSIPYQLLT